MSLPCLSSCVVHGCHGTRACILVPASTAHNRCSRYTFIPPSTLSPDYLSYIIPNATLSLLPGASEEFSQLVGLVKLVVSPGKTIFQIPLVISERLPVPVVVRTAFADGHVCVHQVQNRRP